jgi:poly-gamma-glutamate synthesis protein (capsule biosynthesis protein)
MHKQVNKKEKSNINKLLVVVFLAFILSCFLYLTVGRENKYLPLAENKKTDNAEVNLKILFTGDIFLDRHIDELSQKSVLKYQYPFSGLDTLNRGEYDAWIGNLECPVTDEQSTAYEKENYLKFSCKKAYLSELSKYFTAVSLANNHTNNMNGRKGIVETRKHLDNVGIKYFGDYDSSEKDELCKIIFIATKDFGDQIPIALCGFNGVFQLPTDEELKVISEYSKYFITFVMPHQGEEYKFTANTYQQRIYKQMIDDGADAVYGSHPHVIENIEKYKGKMIFYSLGNFIFDQQWSKTREHLEVETNISLSTSNYKNLDCRNISNTACLLQAKKLNIQKPKFSISYIPIFTEAGTDFITKKENLTQQEYTQKLKSIGFISATSSSKTN